MLRRTRIRCDRRAESVCDVQTFAHSITVSGKLSNKSSQVTRDTFCQSSRRDALTSGLLVPGIFIASGADPAAATGLSCPGLNGYALSKCLKEARLAREAESGNGDVEDERLKNRQYEQPGTLVTLPSGLQYREIEVGRGREASLGATCEINYIVYRLSSGAYYKYSSGGTPILLFALGYGFEGAKDEDERYRFILGEPLSLPAAVTPAVVGMREGGRRRVLVPPRQGWVSDSVGPRPQSFGGGRRLAAHKDEPLLFEVFLSRVRPPAPGKQQQQQQQGASSSDPEPAAPYKLPAPPSPFKSKLGPEFS